GRPADRGRRLALRELPGQPSRQPGQRGDQEALQRPDQSRGEGLYREELRRRRAARVLMLHRGGSFRVAAAQPTTVVIVPPALFLSAPTGWPALRFFLPVARPWLGLAGRRHALRAFFPCSSCMGEIYSFQINWIRSFILLSNFNLIEMYF